MIRTLRRVQSSILAFAVAGFVIVASTSPASATELTTTGSPTGYGFGYKNVLNGKDAFQRLFIVGRSQIPVYSTSFKSSVPNDPSMKFQAVSRSRSGLTNIAQAADIAARSASIRVPLEDRNSEAVAVQLAIWKILENTDISPVGTINVPILQRAEELVENASPSNSPERASAVSVRLSVEKIDDGYRASVVLSSSGKPLPREYVMVKAGSRSLRVMTNDGGVAIAKLPKFNRTTTVTGSFTWSLPAGTVMIPPSGAAVITASAANVSSSASEKIVVRSASQPVAAGTPKAKPTPEPTPKPTPVPSETAAPEPTPTPTEAASGDAEFVDPAIKVIEITPDEPAEKTGKDSIGGLLPLVGVIMLFLLALLVARGRLNNR
jgi:hypothetical protein